MLGRSDLLSLLNEALRTGYAIRAVGGLVTPLTTDDRLFDTEWPRTVDLVLSVSDEIVERGRMYSTVSENPTLAREDGR